MDGQVLRYLRGLADKAKLWRGVCVCASVCAPSVEFIPQCWIEAGKFRKLKVTGVDGFCFKLPICRLVTFEIDTPNALTKFENRQLCF